MRDHAAWDKFWAANTEGVMSLDTTIWDDDIPSWPNAEKYYNASCAIFAKRWAENLDKAVGAGETVAECAERCFLDADGSLKCWGVTNFQSSVALSTLVQCWDRGEELRRWWNVHLDPVQGAEANERGGILSSAVLVVRPQLTSEGTEKGITDGT